MSIYVKTNSNVSKIVEPLIIKGDKTVVSWSTWAFVYGDNRIAYVFIPGIYVTNSEKCNVSFSSDQNLKVRTCSQDEITFTTSEYIETIQQLQGIMFSFNHSGMGYITYGIITTDLTLYP